jgi:hypothetical protein
VERAEVNKDGELELSFSSELPVRRWFGFEVLRHTPKAVDLSYLRSVGTVLFNHDAERIVGPIRKAWAENGQLRTRIAFDETDEGRLRKTQVESGSLLGVSIRYDYGPQDFREVEDGTKEYNTPGPGRDVKRWRPIHLSLGADPADPTVGVGRSREGGLDDDESEGSGASASGATDNQRGSEMPKVKTDAPKPTPDPQQIEPQATATKPEELTTDEARKAGEEVERKRAASIQGFARMAKQPDLGQKYIDEGLSVEAAHKGLGKAWDEANAEPPLGQMPASAPSSGAKRVRDLDSTDVEQALTRKSWLPAAGGDHLSLNDWRDILRNDQGDFDRTTQELLKSGKVTPDQCSLRAWYDAFGNTPVKQTVLDSVNGQLRVVSTSAFAVLAGNTVLARVKAAFEDVPTIGDKLVTLLELDEATTTIPTINAGDNAMKPVPEGHPYPVMGATEATFVIGDKKYGRRIQITDEMVRRDQTGLILRWAGSLGQMMAKFQEKLIINRVCDTLLDGVYVFRPDGTNTSLYSSTARTHGTNKVLSNALVDTTDLENARLKLAAMTDDSGEPILSRAAVLLVPDALVSVAQTFLGSELLPGTVNQINSWGPRGNYQPQLLSSPYMDQIATTGTSSWYLGDPQRQFILKQSVGLETSQQGAESEEMFSSDIRAQFKVRWAGEVGTDGYEYFIQNVIAAS